MAHRGVTLLDKHLAGERLTRGQALVAKCADCMNRWRDGRQDCRIPKCALYPYRPYQGLGVDDPILEESEGSAEAELDGEGVDDGPEAKP
jgi:hypothetical protein